MSAVDLTGNLIGDWTVAMKAPAVNRVRMWTVGHEPCGARVDLPQTMIQAVLKGKGTLPPCATCTPASQGLASLPAISHGMHLACGATHLIGAPCGKAGPGECKHGVNWRTCAECAVIGGLAAPERFTVTSEVGATVIRSARRTLDLDALAADETAYLLASPVNAERLERAMATLDLDALAAEPEDGYLAEMPPVVAERLDAIIREVEVDPLPPFAGWQITDEHAPPAILNREFRDVLLAPMYGAMAGHERNGQVMPGPSAVGGCRRKLAHQLLFADEFVAEPSGWAAMKGTVLHAWYDGLVRQPGWFSDLALPQVVQSVAGGTLDLYVAPARTIVDLKAPGTTTMKAARAGRLSNGYYTQTQVYGLGAEALGLVVEKVGLLFVPMCGDNLDEAIYWEWPYDRAVAESALADAERIVADPRPRLEVLASMPTKSDFCSSCSAFGKYCPGAKSAPAPAASAGLELVRP